MTDPTPRRGRWRFLKLSILPVLLVIVLLAIFYRPGGPGTRRAVSSDAKPHQPDEVLVQPRAGHDWPQFLGPNGTGVSDDTVILTDWPAEGPRTLWEKEVGTGYSAPSVQGNRLVLHHRVGDHEIVECLRADNGKTLWDFQYESRFEDPYGYNNGPRCSPLLTKERCYTYGAEGVLACLELETGKKLWMRDVKDDFDLFKESAFGDKQPNWFFGVGCTPILEDGLLITLVGGQPNSGVVAFDAKTGETVWQNVGRDEWDGAQTDWPDEPLFKWSSDEQIVSYASPVAVTIHGKRHVLCLLRHGLVSLDPTTGDVNFKYWFRSRSFESVNAARPVLIGDDIFITAAYRAGSALLEVSEDGKSVKELWRDQRNMLAHWSTPIHVDGYLYGFSGRHEQEGEFRCVDVTTGQVVWSTTGYDGEIGDLEHDPGTGEIRDRRTGKLIPWPFYGRGSKIQVGDKFIVLGERGTLALVNINSQQFEELARTTYPQLKYPCWTAPVLSRQRLYLRSEDALLCLDLAPKETDDSSNDLTRDNTQ